jgi:hypothetical protein
MNTARQHHRPVAEPLGRRINQKLKDVAVVAREVCRVAIVIYCDDELPPKSRLTESHLDDLCKAVRLLEQAAELVYGLSPEALEG